MWKTPIDNWYSSLLSIRVEGGTAKIRKENHTIRGGSNLKVTFLLPPSMITMQKINVDCYRMEAIKQNYPMETPMNRDNDQTAAYTKCEIRGSCMVVVTNN